MSMPNDPTETSRKSVYESNVLCRLGCDGKPFKNEAFYDALADRLVGPPESVSHPRRERSQKIR
jgi:hypothetical protein